MLSHIDLAKFTSLGYLVLPGFSNIAECRAMIEQAWNYVYSCDPASDVRCFRYATGLENNAQRNDAYFFESTNKVSCFFEENCFDVDKKNFANKLSSIVKLGHALHDCDPVFRSYSHSAKVQTIARALGYRRPLIGQSRYFFRLPDSNKSFPPHQDSSALYTEPLSCVGLWLALEEARVDNGCLWVIPGSQRFGLLKRMVKDQTGLGSMRILVAQQAVDDQAFIPLEVPAGTLIILSGELIHKSNRNRSKRSRQAYGMHLIEGAEDCTYSRDNWLQRPGGFGALTMI
jgi:phytanoyl-CoA hydroxylase